jgi:hypothetical protein
LSDRDLKMSTIQSTAKTFEYTKDLCLSVEKSSDSIELSIGEALDSGWNWNTITLSGKDLEAFLNWLKEGK